MKRRVLFAFCLPAFCLFAAAAGTGCRIDSEANPGRRCNTDEDCGDGICYRNFCVGDPDGSAGDLGGIDGGEACTSEGELRACYDGPAGSDEGLVPCHGGEQECRSGYWGRCIGQVIPAAEIACNGIDDDCDHTIDEIDGLSCSTGLLGVCASGVRICQGSEVVCTATITPGVETCNNRDDDCDGEIDEEITVECYDGAASGCTPTAGGKFECDGSCQPGLKTCTLGQFSECAGLITPVGEVCTSTRPGEIAVDENCDGTIDENCVCQSGSMYACYTGPEGTSNAAPCHPGNALCSSNALGPCVDQVVPAIESCANEGRDDDCDGTADDILGRGDTCTVTATAGICRNGTRGCIGNALTCVTAHAAREACNNLDDDCDGAVDEDFPFLTDRNNCGGCNRTCAAGLECCGGHCVDTHTDADNCRTCGNDCGQDRLCCSSTCRDRLTDENNCGTCGNVCPNNFTCCGGVCLDTRSSTSACGGCSTPCTGANQRCCNSVCSAPTAPACTGCTQTCGTNEFCCPPVCTNRMTDPNNCGQCGRVCSSNQLCCGGSCVANDSPNCGNCGNTCGGDERCCTGQCTPIDASNCAGCGDLCSAGDACCISGCETTNAFDNMNCGGCGVSCPGGRSCSFGSCCPSGQTGCGAASGVSGSSCRDLDGDDNNCGSCFHACSNILFPTCLGGQCCGLLGCI